MFELGGACVAAGAAELVDELVDDVAASAIAAPPTTPAATAAPVTRMDLMFLMSLLWLFETTSAIVRATRERHARAV
jgi:hypothetical protein